MGNGKAHDSILKEGETCWRIADAHRVALLIDGARYFAALRASLLKARRSVFIAGWDIDSRMRLVGPSGSADDGYPEQLGAFLTALVAERPQLKIHILLWDYTMLYALDREPLPSLNLAWRTPPQISVCLDDVLPVGACHHQKLVVVDDTVAFCGGLDLTARRWDTSRHDADNEARVDPGGTVYRPFHDMQMLIDGDAAQSLGELMRQRWRSAACETPLDLSPEGDPWPDHVEADFTDISMGIARTQPAHEGSPEVREIESLYCRAIETAESAIYIECQYLTAERVAEALAKRMRENEALEVLIVAPNIHQSWLEEHSMNTGRRRFVTRLQDAGVADRMRLVFPTFPGDYSGEGVMVHAKLMIVDDRFLLVGSANMNNRSMGVDTECNLAIDVEDEARRETIAAIRNRLLAEHLGKEPDTVADALAEHESLLAAVKSLSGDKRTLQPIDVSDVPDDEISRTVIQLADPERPANPPAFVGDMFGGESAGRPILRVVKLAALAVVLAALVAAWRFTPLSDYTDPAELARWLGQLATDYWMPVAMPLIYIIGGLIVFPITALIVVTSMMFDPVTAVAYALAGSLSSAAVTFGVGHGVGRAPLRNAMGPRVNRISRRLARRGVLSVAALRMVPIAPFSVINLVAGASHIGFLDFLLGTVAGMAPGILVICLLGHQLLQVLKDPSTTQILLLLLGVAAWLLLSVVLQWLASKLNRERRE